MLKVPDNEGTATAMAQNDSSAAVIHRPARARSGLPIRLALGAGGIKGRSPTAAAWAAMNSRKRSSRTRKISFSSVDLRMLKTRASYLSLVSQRLTVSHHAT
jgi:hypothetical protein